VGSAEQLEASDGYSALNLTKGRPVVQPAIQRYDEAWNAPDADVRRRLLEDALTDDCELIDPNGRFSGRVAILQRIGGFTERFPGAQVRITSAIDAHHDFARYGWEIRDVKGDPVLQGIDVVEARADGKLERILMFFGELSTV
jgi:hypothetical protein